MTRKRPQFFYGWLIVFLSSVGLFLGAPLLVFSFSVFFKSLATDFHANRAAVSFAFSLINIVGALWLPATGMLIDRFGAKRVIVSSALLYGLALISALWVGSSLWQLYLLSAVLGITFTSGAAPVPYGVVISHWFNRHRGLALGLSMMGIGAGSIVVPILAQRLIASFGWRIAFAVFGAAVLLIPLPLVAVFLRNGPGQRNLQPDGGESTPDASIPTQEKQGLSWHAIWHDPTYWSMLCIFSLAGASVHGAILHMSAIFSDRGVSPERAALATSLVGAALVVGRLGSGYLLDRLFAPRVAILFYGATTLGIGILCAGTAGNLALVGAFLVGLGMGAEVEVMAYMIGRYFGLLAFGSAYGYAFGAFMISGAAGVLLMGIGYDRFHSYTVPLAAFCTVMLLALILLTRLGPYRYGVETETIEPVEPIQVASSV
jgi:MFS family permease